MFLVTSHIMQIQPVGYKDRSWTPGEDIRCPSEVTAKQTDFRK